MGCAGSKGGAAKDNKKKEDKPAEAPAEGEAESAPAAEEQPVSAALLPHARVILHHFVKISGIFPECVTSSPITDGTQRLKLDPVTF